MTLYLEAFQLNVMNNNTITYFHMDGAGWWPIDRLFCLMSDLLDLKVERPALPELSKFSKFWNELKVGQKGGENGSIYLTRSPAEIRLLPSLKDFSKPKKFRALWIVDSFRTEHIRSKRFMSQFDLVIYMQKGDTDFYENLAPGRSLYLPWGADVLDLGASNSTRPMDVLRVGRQPDAWENNTQSAAVCQEKGLVFSGRPPFAAPTPSDPSQPYRELHQYYSRTKCVIAHSNLVGTANYTHRAKEYITGRWTDALAAGAIVAGVQPYDDSSSEDLFWPGATINFQSVDLVKNVAALKEALEDWTPSIVQQNYYQALCRLDWRWRLQKLANRLEIRSPKLEIEMNRLKKAIRDAEPIREN